MKDNDKVDGDDGVSKKAKDDDRDATVVKECDEDRGVKVDGDVGVVVKGDDDSKLKMVMKMKIVVVVIIMSILLTKLRCKDSLHLC